MTTFANAVTRELTADLAWREDELAIMRKQLIVSPSKSLQEIVLLRANLAMIYAHYEGFCKFALEVYISALEKLSLKRKDLGWPLATYSLGELHKNLLAEKDRESFFALLMNEFDKHLEQTASYERPPQIANLWPELLVEWMNRLNLDSKNINNEHTLLNSLVNKRNQIAHGKKLSVSNRGELDKYAHAAMLAMHEVALGISEALEKKSYRRKGEVYTILGHAISGRTL